ncbi:MAG: hypothetical protein WC549_01935 [Actinomycetota bacterium]
MQELVLTDCSGDEIIITPHRFSVVVEAYNGFSANREAIHEIIEYLKKYLEEKTK